MQNKMTDLATVVLYSLAVAVGTTRPPPAAATPGRPARARGPGNGRGPPAREAMVQQAPLPPDVVGQALQLLRRRRQLSL